MHPYTNEIIECDTIVEEISIQDEEPAQCEIIIEPSFVIQNYSANLSMGIGGDGASTNKVVLQDTSTSSNTIVDYQWSVTSS